MFIYPETIVFNSNIADSVNKSLTARALYKHISVVKIMMPHVSRRSDSQKIQTTIVLVHVKSQL